MALARFRFPDSSPSYTPEFPQGAALNHEPPALPLSYAGPYARFYGMSAIADNDFKSIFALRPYPFDSDDARRRSDRLARVGTVQRQRPDLACR